MSHHNLVELAKRLIVGDEAVGCFGVSTDCGADFYQCLACGAFEETVGYAGYRAALDSVATPTPVRCGNCTDLLLGIKKGTSMKTYAPVLCEVANNPDLLETGRRAVEDALIELRDLRIAVPRNNGLVCREQNGNDSHIIRMGSETAVRIAILAIAERLEAEV